jgi:hypothetical protein
MNPKVKDVLYTYADFPNLPRYIRKMFEDVPMPFYIIIDKGPIKQPHVHLYPGKSCYKQLQEIPYTKVTSHSMITDFVRSYFTGNDRPILKNQADVTAVQQNNTQMFDLFNRLL